MLEGIWQQQVAEARGEELAGDGEGTTDYGETPTPPSTDGFSSHTSVAELSALASSWQQSVREAQDMQGALEAERASAVAAVEAMEAAEAVEAAEAGRTMAPLATVAALTTAAETAQGSAGCVPPQAARAHKEKGKEGRKE